MNRNAYIYKTNISKGLACHMMLDKYMLTCDFTHQYGTPNDIS